MASVCDGASVQDFYSGVHLVSFLAVPGVAGDKVIIEVQ